MREDVNFPLRDAAFQNIHFVSSTVKATKDIVDSLESDINDIKSVIRAREQARTDREQLIMLLQTENKALHVSTSSSLPSHLIPCPCLPAKNIPP